MNTISGPTSDPSVGRVLTDIALNYMVKGDLNTAETTFRKAIAIREKASGLDSLSTSYSLDPFALLLTEVGKFQEAEGVFKRSLRIAEQHYGNSSAIIVRKLIYFSHFYVTQHRYEDAKVLLDRLFDSAKGNAGVPEVTLVWAQMDLAQVYLRTGREVDALELARQAGTKASTALAEASLNPEISEISELNNWRGVFKTYLQIIAEQPGDPHLDDPKVVDEAFRTMQRAGAIETARVVSNVAANLSVGTGSAGELLHERDALRVQLQTKDAQLRQALSRHQESKSPNAGDESTLRKEIASAKARFDEINNLFRQNFPRIADMINALPVSVADVQKNLDDKEALVTFSLSDPSYVIAISRDTAIFREIKISEAEVNSAVETLRQSLDLPSDRLFVELPPFNVGLAHDLYKRLFEPIQSLLDSSKNLIIVPAGRLFSLPPAVLVTDAPDGSGKDGTDYKSAAWLIRNHALTVLPAVSTLVALRRYPKAESATKPFVGFGNPDFRGTLPPLQGTEEAIKAQDRALQGSVDDNSVH